MKKAVDFLKQKLYQHIKLDFFKNNLFLLMISIIGFVLTTLSFLVPSRYIAIPGLMIVILSSIIFGSRGAIFSLIWITIIFLNTIIFVPAQTLYLSFKNPFILNYIVIYLTAFVIAKSIDYIYEQKQKLDKSQQRYNSVVQTQNDMICRFKTDTTLTFVNDAYCSIFDKTKSELLGEKFIDLIPKDEHNDVYEKINSLSKDNPIQTYSHKAIGAEGRISYQEWTDYAIFDKNDKILEIQSVGRDITKLKKAQKDAEKANKMKSLFLANISHEIRTPLNVIIGFTEILEEEDFEKEQKKYLDAIKIAGDSLLSLINDILDISKIESDTFTIKNEYIDISSLAEEMNYLFKEKLHKKELEFKIEIPEIEFFVFFDIDIIRRILINLINNAIKFTDKGFVKLQLKIDNIDQSQEKADLYILVEDTGIGIAVDKQENIFAPFTQLENIEKHDGTGLGLTITKKLVEQMEGEIKLESEINQGSKFHLIFPARKIKEYKISSEKLFVEQSSSNIKVLIVDDEELNRELLRIKLEKRGIKVVEAENGKTAYNKFIKENPDLILMDLKMPEEDGYSVLKRIKNNKQQSDLKIIAVSAAATSEEKAKAIKAGFDDFVAKPITRHKLNNLFEEYI